MRFWKTNLNSQAWFPMMKGRHDYRCHHHHHHSFWSMYDSLVLENFVAVRCDGTHRISERLPSAAHDLSKLSHPRGGVRHSAWSPMAWWISCCPLRWFQWLPTTVDHGSGQTKSNASTGLTVRLEPRPPFALLCHTLWYAQRPWFVSLCAYRA